MAPRRLPVKFVFALRWHIFERAPGFSIVYQLLEQAKFHRMEKSRPHGAACKKARCCYQIRLLEYQLRRLIFVPAPAYRARYGWLRRGHCHADAKRTRAIPTTAAAAIFNWCKAAVPLSTPLAIRPPLHCRPNVVRLHTSTAIFYSFNFCRDKLPTIHANLCVTGSTSGIPCARHVLAKSSPRHQAFAKLLPNAISRSFVSERARVNHVADDGRRRGRLLRGPIRPGMEIACWSHKIHHKIDYKGS